MPDSALRKLNRELGDGRYESRDHDRAYKALRREATVMPPHAVGTYKLPFKSVPEATFAPDGTFAFVGRVGAWSDIYVGFDPRTGQPHKLDSDLDTGIYELHFTPRGTLVYARLTTRGRWFARCGELEMELDVGSSDGRTPKWFATDNLICQVTDSADTTKVVTKDGERRLEAILSHAGYISGVVPVGDGVGYALRLGHDDPETVVVGSWQQTIDTAESVIPATISHVCGRPRVGRFLTKHPTESKLTLHRQGCAPREFEYSKWKVFGTQQGRLILAGHGPSESSTWILHDLDKRYDWKVKGVEELLEVFPLTDELDNQWYASVFMPVSNSQGRSFIVSGWKAGSEQVLTTYGYAPVVRIMKVDASTIAIAMNAPDKQGMTLWLARVNSKSQEFGAAEFQLACAPNHLTPIADGSVMGWDYKDDILTLFRYAFPR